MTPEQPMIDRRTVVRRLALAGLALPATKLLAACAPATDPSVAAPSPTSSGPASNVAAPRDLRKVTVTQAVTSMAFLQNYVAASQGFFEREGLKVEIVDTGGGGPDVQAVLAGDAAFTINDGAQVLPALNQGKQLTAVMATLDKNVINVTMHADTADRLGVGPDSSYDDKVAALEGLKIGITGPGSLTWQLARYNLVKAGFDPDRDAEVVGLGGGAAVLAGLEQHQVDVIYISVPLGEVGVHRGAGVTLVNNAAGEDPTLPSFMMEGLWTRPQTVDEDPELVTSMVRAMQAANAFIVESASSDVVAAISDTFGNFDQEVLEVGVSMIGAAVARSDRWTDEAVATTQEVLVANDILDEASFGLADFFDDRFLDA